MGQKGFSLLELVIAAAIMGFMAVTMLVMINSEMNAQKSLEFRFNVQQLADEVASMLSNPTLCMQVFGKGMTLNLAMAKNNGNPGSPGFTSNEPKFTGQRTNCSATESGNRELSNAHVGS
jgi:prepilin-type N-terminal cleavage/methylation domain-containing protein